MANKSGFNFSILFKGVLLSSTYAKSTISNAARLAYLISSVTCGLYIPLSIYLSEVTLTTR